MSWDETTVSRWLEPLASRAGEIAEVFSERMREVSLDWRDGQVHEARVRREEGVGARWRFQNEERFAFVSGAGEAAVREAVRALRSAAGREPLPIRAPRAAEEDAEGAAETERWTRRLTGILGRHVPRHRFRWRAIETERRIVSSGSPASSSRRRLVSLEGRFTAASRHGDEERPIAFHAPDIDSAPDELRDRLAATSTPRDRPVAVGAGETDVVLAEGCAAVLFHEILGHALEADAPSSPLSALKDARVAVAELDVHDDARRLDLFGGYERDDEGTAPREVKLLHSGHIGSRLTDRAHARPPGGSTGHGRRSGPAETPSPRCSNVVVRAGSATSDEIARRVGDGIWIEEFHSGSVELSGGTFRLRFPRARRLRRGRFTEELGPGILAGDILGALKNVEAVLGREARPCRSLGWCARDGQVVPVQGESPDVLIRRLAVRPAL